MIRHLIFSTILFTFANCTFKQDKNQNFDIGKDTIQISNIKRLSMYWKTSRDSFDSYINLKMNDVFIFDEKEKKLSRYLKSENSEKVKDSVIFTSYQLTKRDQRKFLPAKILDFELKGIYTNQNVFEDDIGIFCYYLDPKTQDLLMIRHTYFIGNVADLHVYSDDIEKDYWKDNQGLLKEVFRLGTELINSDTTTINFDIKAH